MTGGADGASSLPFDGVDRRGVFSDDISCYNHDDDDDDDVITNTRVTLPIQRAAFEDIITSISMDDAMYLFREGMYH